MKVEITELAGLRVGAIRHLGPYMEIGNAFERLGSIAGSAGLFAQPGAMMVAIYYDDPRTTAPEALRSDAAIVVPERATLPAGLTETRLVAGTYVMTVHTGPYSGLPSTWARLISDGLPTSGRTMKPGPNYEIYRNNPMTTSAAELVTEIYIPVV